MTTSTLIGGHSPKSWTSSTRPPTLPAMSSFTIDFPNATTGASTRSCKCPTWQFDQVDLFSGFVFQVCHLPRVAKWSFVPALLQWMGVRCSCKKHSCLGKGFKNHTKAVHWRSLRFRNPKTKTEHDTSPGWVDPLVWQAIQVRYLTKRLFEKGFAISILHF